MNGAYLHLAINHIPVVLAPVSVLLLVGALIRKSQDLAQAGFLALVLVGIIVYPTVKTGRMAAGVVRTLPGIEMVRIHQHAEAADWAPWPSIILGVLSLLGIWKSKDSFPAGLAVLALLGSLFLTAIMVRVAHLGGLVRHPEIAAAAAAPTPPK